MLEADWDRGFAKSLGIFLNGETIPNPYPRGEPVTDDNFYIIFNAHHETLTFILPGSEWGQLWIKEHDTAGGLEDNPESFKAGSKIRVYARSMIVLRHAS